MSSPAALLSDLSRRPWAMLPDRLAELVALARRVVAGETAPAELEAALGTGRSTGSTWSNGSGIAVIPVFGVLYPRSWWSAGTLELRQLVTAAAASSKVKALLLDIDSPGGSVYGTAELADAVHAAKKAKPVWAVADPLAASAAYWVGAQATRLYVSPSGDVGSVGVWTAHIDESAALERMGLKVSLISAGRYKTEGNPFEPLSDEGRRHLQQTVDDSFGDFVAAVARGRGTFTSAVRRGFGEGRVVGAKEAVRLGMVDAIAPADEVLARFQRELSAGTAGAPGMPAAARAAINRRRAELAILEMS